MFKRLLALFFCMLLLTGCMENTLTPTEETQPTSTEDVNVPAETGNEAVAPEATTPTETTEPTTTEPTTPTTTEPTQPTGTETPAPTEETPPANQ